MGKCYFVDKSLFIKEIIDDSAEVILITRPRRFGKTLTLSMVRHFLQISFEQNLFVGLNISKDEKFCEEYQHKYPIIFVSFKDIKKASYVQAYKSIVNLMKNLYTENIYLLEGGCLHEHEKNTFVAILNKQADQTDVEEAINQLSLYLYRQFDKMPIILIDEYDTPIQEAYLKGYYDQMIELMRGYSAHR